MNEIIKKDHPLWNPFVDWIKENNRSLIPYLAYDDGPNEITPWQPYWKCFLAGVEAYKEYEFRKGVD